MTISKLAPAMPTRIAAVTTAPTFCPGSASAKLTTAAMTALPVPTEHRQANAIHDPCPEEFEIVGEEDKRERGDRRFVDPVLLEARRQRRADHRIWEA